MKVFLVLLMSLGLANGTYAVQDTTIFRYDDFYWLVLENHPVVKQSELLSEKAKAGLRMARGSFDPKAGLSYSKKSFGGDTYYNLFNAGLKVPVWFPVDLEAGITKNTGEYLNPEHYISESTDNTQIYTGVSVPIGRGLFMDERRATVKKALIFQQLTEAEQIKAINKVLLQAAKDYWAWYATWNTFELMEQNVVLAEDIFRRTKLAYENGEVAVIDTIQAKTTLLQRRNDLMNAETDHAIATLKLSNNLWDEEGRPLEIAQMQPESFYTEVLSQEEMAMLFSIARENHPELMAYRLKGESLFVDRSLARENLKPVLNLKYHLLDQPWEYNGEPSSLEFAENYRLGVEVELPLFLRKERGKLDEVNVKITENQYQQEYSLRVIVNRVNAQYLQLLNLNELILQQEQMVVQYQLLVDAERFNLENGESDLFKINFQLEKLIGSRSKLIKMQEEYRKAVAELYWAAGVSGLKI